MPTKIRLQRHGKKRYAYFHVVIADSRAPRDGKFIEKLGTYNPNTNPATIDVDFDSALSWLKKGAQPTDTVRALLSYKGVIYKNHLDKGVTKGAFTQEEADKKFEEWMEAKDAKINSKKEKLAAESDAEFKKRMAGEEEANKKKADSIAAKNSALAGEEISEEAAPEEGEAAAETTEEVAAEAAPEATEAPAEVKKEEAPVEAKEETPAAVTKEEAPVAESTEATTEGKEEKEA